jgi:hypothetical protein
VQLAALRPLIQRLNVFQPMFKPITAQIDFVLRDRVEHERIVWVGRMPKCKGFSGILCHLEFVIQTVFAFGSYTKGCVTQFTHSGASQTKFSRSRRSVSGTGGKAPSPWDRRFAPAFAKATACQAAKRLQYNKTAAARVSRGG